MKKGKEYNTNCAIRRLSDSRQVLLLSFFLKLRQSVPSKSSALRDCCHRAVLDSETWRVDSDVTACCIRPTDIALIHYPDTDMEIWIRPFLFSWCLFFVHAYSVYYVRILLGLLMRWLENLEQVYMDFIKLGCRLLIACPVRKNPKSLIFYFQMMNYT